jgi:hypothetical protein
MIVDQAVLERNPTLLRRVMRPYRRERKRNRVPCSTKPAGAIPWAQKDHADVDDNDEFRCAACHDALDPLLRDHQTNLACQGRGVFA